MFVGLVPFLLRNPYKNTQKIMLLLHETKKKILFKKLIKLFNTVNNAGVRFIVRPCLWTNKMPTFHCTVLD